MSLPQIATGKDPSDPCKASDVLLAKGAKLWGPYKYEEAQKWLMNQLSVHDFWVWERENTGWTHASRILGLNINTEKVSPNSASDSDLCFQNEDIAQVDGEVVPEFCFQQHFASAEGVDILRDEAKRISEATGDFTNSAAHIEDLEALTGYKDHLDFAEALLSGILLNDKDRSQWEERLEQIRERIKDSRYRLAVVGEFSSGKSTFINALLRDELLPSAVTVTTATVTHLSHASRLNAKVKFRGKPAFWVATKDDNSPILLPWLQGVNGIDVRTFIRSISSREENARLIDTLQVALPSSFLAGGVVIIDTPGINATNPRHGKLTRNILDQEADAAIVIIPATVPVSQSLVQFLSGPLRPYLHRCIFVATRFDQIRKSEQESLWKEIRLRLESDLGVKDPIVYPCAARVVLDELDPEEEVQDHLHHWIARFGVLESHIFKRLQAERRYGVAESVLRLLEALLGRVEFMVQEQRADYERKQAAIEREAIPDIEAHIQEQKVESRQLLSRLTKDARERLGSRLEGLRKSGMELASVSIRTAESDSELDSFAHEGPSLIAKRAYKALNELLLQELVQVQQWMEAARLHHEKYIATACRRMEGLPTTAVENTSPVIGLDLDSSAVLSNVESELEALNFESAKWLAGGATAGAVLGNFMLPVVGILIGGVVGAFTTWLFSSVDERKEKLKAVILPGLDKFYLQLLNEANALLDQQLNQISEQHELDLDKVSIYYQETVSALRSRQNLRLSELQSLKQIASNSLEDLARRLRQLQVRQEQLAQAALAAGYQSEFHTKHTGD